jgi:hypothetical protein
VTPVSTFLAVTMAPGTLAPLTSFTVPSSVAVLFWATIVQGVRAKTTAHNLRAIRFIDLSPKQSGTAEWRPLQRYRI